jgi:CHAT domain-containing protein
MSSSDRPSRDAAPVGGPGAGWTQHNVATDGGAVFGTQGGNIVIRDGSWLRAPSPGASAADRDRIRILLLAANPAATQRLALDEEARQIEEKLRLSRDRDRFELFTRWAVRPDDLLRFLNEISPHVVHFSGHGSAVGEIMLSTDGGVPRPVAARALAEVFRVMRHDIRVVLLNACYSAVQARAIGEHIDYLVGMRAALQDDAAIAFSAAFYSALGYGRPVPEAFEQAVAAVMVHGLPGHDIPQLFIRSAST